MSSVPGSHSTSLENSAVEYGRPQCIVRLWIFINSFSCIFIVFPLVIVYWSGSWKLLDLYIFPGNPETNSIVCAAAGSILLLLAYFVLPLLKLALLRHENTWKYIILSRVVSYVCGGIIIIYWHGWYGLQDVYIPDKFKCNIILALVPAAILIPCKCLSALVSTPFQCSSDLASSIFNVKPRFRTTIDNLWKYSLDCMFTCWFIHLLPIVSFRAVWNLIDEILGPNKHLNSYLLTLAAGIGATVIIYCIQGIMYKIANKLYCINPWLYLAFVDFYKLLCYVPNIAAWYGGWGFFKDLVLFHAWQGWLFHVIGVVGLLVLQVGLTISDLTMPVDGELGEGQDVLLPVDHLSICFNAHQSPRVWNQGVLFHEERQSLLDPDSQYPVYS